ncbi:hypothetical protein [Flavobacterium sp. '19STA2R22 D10 B1']|uniref:hypothetical protein n=1 Tax=Flavobacterium aerium TaxID=3037261 RepID=UPI00278BAF76|nr:hypothetical protein [Flavobacterium sp. '19STA2R22 D10 B1']
MKTKITTFRNSMVAFLLLGSLHVFAQNPVFQSPISTPTNLQVGTQVSTATTVTVVDGAVLFYNPATTGPTFTLSASLTDSGTPVQTFTSYSWHEITKSGGNEVEGTVLGSAQTLVIGSAADGIEPGYHKYRVYGNVANTGVSCQSAYEDIILFVLPPLTTTAAVSSGTSFAYCTNNLPDASTGLVFNPTIVYDAAHPLYNSGFANPAVSDFTLTYKWYAIKDGNTAAPIDLGTSLTATAPIFTDPGTYTFFVEVEYINTIKDKGARTYVTYKGQVMNGATAVTVVVSPAPGAPTITITGVTD